MKPLQFILPVLLLLGGAVRSAALSVTFTHIPTTVNAGESYFVRAEGYSNFGVTTTLWKNGQYLNSGDGSPWSAAAVWTADAGPATVGFTAEGWDWEWGNSVFDYRTVTVNGGAANQPPIATVEVDGQYNGATVVRPYGGSLAITVRYKATDADGNLSGIRPQVWSPDGNLNNNGGSFVGQSGASGEVAWTVYLNQNGNWYFWTDAQDSVISPSYVDSGAWGSGFRINVIEGAPPPQNPSIWLNQPAGDITVNVGTTVTLQSYAEDFSRPLTTHNLDIQKPDGTWNWYGGFAYGEPYMGGPIGPDAPTASLRTAGFNFNIVGTWQVRSYAANNAGLATHSVTRTVTVLPLAQAAVGISPASVAVTVGQSVAFTASGGSGSGAYLWGGSASGSGSSQTVTFNSAGTHTVTVYRAGDSTYAQSNTATATITVSLANQSTVSISPTAQTITAGQAVAFTAAGGSGSGAYVWGGDATGTGTTKTITFNTTGTRTVTVYRQGDSTYNTSNTATATITVNAGQTVAITPPSASVTVGQSVAFSASGGGGTGDYVWGGDASGTGASKSVTFNTVGPRTVTVYRQASSGYSQSNTATSTIDVSAAPPATIAQQPQSQTAVTGSTVTFSVSATGTGTLSYQWLKNGNAIVGATGSTLSLANVQTTDSAGYSVVVTHNGTATTSNTAWLPIAEANGGGSASSPTAAQKSPVAPGLISTTAGGSGYDIATGSISRVVRDFAVTGSVGAYPLEMTRTFTGSVWGYSFVWFVEEVANADFLQNPMAPTAQQFLNVRTPDGQHLNFDARRNDFPTVFYQSAEGARVAVVREANQRIGAVALHFTDGGYLLMERADETTTRRYFRPVYLVDPFGLKTQYSYASATSRIPLRVTDATGRYLEFTSSGTDVQRVESSDSKWIQWNGSTLNYWDGLSASFESGLIPNTNRMYYRFRDVRQTSAMRNVEYILEKVNYGPAEQASNPINFVWEVIEEKNADSLHVVSTRTVTERRQVIEEGGIHATGPATKVTETRGDGASRSFEFQPSGGKMIRASNYRGHYSNFDEWFGNIPNKIRDARGYETRIASDGWGQISRITYPLTEVVPFLDGTDPVQTVADYREYQWTGRFLTGERDERGNWTTYQRDALNRIEKIIYADTSYEQFFYNALNQLEKRRLRNGAFEYWDYYADTKLPYRFWPANDASPGNVITQPYFEYTYYTTGPQKGLMLTSRDPRGKVTTFEYFDSGLLKKETFHDASFRSYTYDNWGNRLTATDELGQTTTWTYDAYNRVQTVKDPALDVTTHDYTPSRNDTLSPLVHVASVIRRTTQPSLRKTAFKHNDDYHVTEEIRGEGSAEEAKSTMLYDEAGNLASRTDQVSTGVTRVTTYAYDARNRKRTEFAPLSRTTKWKYDSVGNVTKVINPDSTATTKTYNAMNQVATSADEMGDTTEYRYYLSGLVWKIIDPRLKEYVHTYDAVGRIKSRTYPDNPQTQEKWDYDAAGNVEFYYNRDNRKQNYTYDDRNRELTRTWDNSGATVAAPAVSTTYHANGLVWTRSNGVSTLTNTYHADGALHTQQQALVGGPSNTITLTYDVDGRRETFNGGAGRTLGYVYNDRGGLWKVLNGGLAGSNLATFTYNFAEQRLTRTAGNNIGTTHDYDGAGRLNLINAAGVLRLDFGHDLRDRRKWTKRNSTYGDTYTYHADSELERYQHQVLNPDNPGANQPSYATDFLFDDSGNRTSVQRTGQGASSTLYAAGNDNRYDTVNVNGSSMPIAHDARGNVTTWDGKTFTYDADNRLRSVSGTGLTMTLDYDGDGRLVKLVKNGTAEYRFYDGAQCFLRTNAGGAQLDWTVWGPTPDEVIARQSGGAWQYYHQDPINSVVAVTDSTGLVVERYLYDVFGLPDIRDSNGNSRASTAIDNPWLFTGQEWRGDLGLSNYKARWYQPTLGRFMQNDPVRFDAGDINLYRYCGNNPINHTDPTGKVVETAWDAANAAMGWASAYQNFKEGNIGAAIVDTIGASVDTAATAIPLVPGGISTGIKLVRAADKAADAVKAGEKAADVAKALPSRNAALREAKAANDVPLSAQPDTTIKPGTPEGKKAGLDDRNVVQYEYTNSKGEKISIREDKPATYPEGGAGNQGAHFNSGKSGEKLKEHHYFDSKKK